MPELLVIERLRAGYGEAVVLSDISFALPEGKSLALLGRNGMGKTTLVNSVIGVTRYLGGVIRLAGRDITRLRPDQRAHAGGDEQRERESTAGGCAPCRAQFQHQDPGPCISNSIPDPLASRPAQRFLIRSAGRSSRSRPP